MSYEMKKLLEAMSGANPLGDPTIRTLRENIEDEQSEFNSEIGFLLHALRKAGHQAAYDDIMAQVREVALNWVSAYEGEDVGDDDAGMFDDEDDEDFDEDEDDEDYNPRLDSWADEMRDWVRSVPHIAAKHGVTLQQYGDDPVVDDEVDEITNQMYTDPDQEPTHVE